MKQSEKMNPPPQTEADIADTREQDRLPLNNLVDGEPLTGKSGERPSPRSHPGQLEQEISRGEKLDYWVREITAPSRQTLDGMLQIGARILEAEASGLSHEEIRQLQEKRLPFSSSDYSKYRNIAAHEGIIDPKYRERLPVARSTLYLLSLLPPAAFKTAVAQDKIHCRMSREDAEHLRDDAFAALGKAGKKKKARVAAKTQAQDRAQTGGRVESPGK